MSKLVAIFYTALILFQSLNISLEDVSKFSVLMEHASYHQETYGDSFVDFISEHYGDADIHHEDEHPEHDDLPFKHDHESCCHANISFTFHSFDFANSSGAFLEIPFNFYYKESISLFEKPSVFQPPRFA